MTSKESDFRIATPRRALTLALAEEAAAAARAKATAMGIHVSVAVVDEGGHLVYFTRDDACSFITAETSRGKALMAAGFRSPTDKWTESLAQNASFWTSLSFALGMVPGLGGYPLSKDGALMGAIGCGGGLGDEDQVCAKAGAEAVNT